MHRTRLIPHPILPPSLLALTLILASCMLESPHEPQPKTQADQRAFDQVAFMGPWSEKLPENVIYFEGSRLELDFARDSLRFQEHHWSDVRTCVESSGTLICNDGSWIKSYRGTWTLQDSVLRIEYRFVPVTTSPGADATSYHAEFRIAPESDETVRLEFLGPGEFLRGKKNILLQRPQSDSLGT